MCFSWGLRLCAASAASGGDEFQPNGDASTSPPTLNDFVCFNNAFAAGCP
ncbi:MAG: hypothetical protein JNM80_14365 [Phycisphaerae bacterium]|nr:hypothetical protein [Phycisphaerae bacterium]